MTRAQPENRTPARHWAAISLLLSPWLLLCLAPLLLAYARGLTEWTAVWTAQRSLDLLLIFALPLALSLYSAHLLSSRSPALARSIDLLATLPVTLPQSVIALSLVLFWSQPDWRHSFYNSHLLLPLGLALILTPALYWCLRLSRITTPNRFHEAADLTGLSFFHRFWIIDLRAARHWMILGIGAIATAALGNLEASQLLSRAGGGTLSQLIARNLHYGRDASMASHCLILVSMIAGVALITLTLLKLSNRKPRAL